MGDDGTNAIAPLLPCAGPGYDEIKIFTARNKTETEASSMSMNLISGSEPLVEKQAMLALFSFPVDLFGTAVVFIALMAGMLAAAPELSRHRCEQSDWPA